MSPIKILKKPQAIKTIFLTEYENTGFCLGIARRITHKHDDTSKHARLIVIGEPKDQVTSYTPPFPILFSVNIGAIHQVLLQVQKSRRKHNVNICCLF